MLYKSDESDIEKIVEFRIKLLVEEAAYPQNNIEEEVREYFKSELNKSLVIMLAEKDGITVATSSVIYQKYPPSFSNRKGLRA